MSLTTEQKINLLILAGFEPYFSDWGPTYLRICKGTLGKGTRKDNAVFGPVLYRNESDKVDEWHYSDMNETDVARATWDKIEI